RPKVTKHLTSVKRRLVTQTVSLRYALTLTSRCKLTVCATQRGQGTTSETRDSDKLKAYRTCLTLCRRFFPLAVKNCEPRFGLPIIFVKLDELSGIARHLRQRHLLRDFVQPLLNFRDLRFQRD